MSSPSQPSQREKQVVVAQLLLGYPSSADYGADEIISAVYAQPEPWRTRFLQLAAKAVSRNSNGRAPERSEVETWLRQSRSLRQQMAALLRTWNGTRGLDPETKDV